MLAGFSVWYMGYALHCTTLTLTLTLTHKVSTRHGLVFIRQRQEGFSTPNTRSQRKLCWESRDVFFQCLDRANVLDATDPKNGKIIGAQCPAENKKFEENCAHSWIKYFKEKRITDFRREEAIKKIEQEAQQREHKQ